MKNMEDRVPGNGSSACSSVHRQHIESINYKPISNLWLGQNLSNGRRGTLHTRHKWMRHCAWQRRSSIRATNTCTSVRRLLPERQMLERQHNYFLQNFCLCRVSWFHTSGGCPSKCVLSSKHVWGEKGIRSQKCMKYKMTNFSPGKYGYSKKAPEKATKHPAQSTTYNTQHRHGVTKNNDEIKT